MFQLAWRNLWRNSRRTVITLMAVALSTALLMMTDALMIGFIEHAVKNATNISVGEAQIHDPDYLTEHSMYDTVDNAEQVMATLDEEGIPAAPRSFGFGLLSNGAKSAGAQFWGIDPRRERDAFDLPTHIIPGMGSFITEDMRGKIVLGKKLAKTLQAEPGSELVIVVQAADGSLGNELYVVAGVLKTIGDAIDRGAAILHREDFERLFVSGGRIHEIAVNSRGTLTLPELATLLKQMAPAQEIKTWRLLLPILSDFMNTIDVTMWIFMSIFLIAAGLGVMNTMIMATHERIHEFGVIKALGATNARIFRDVAAEAVLLGFLSTLLGVMIGFVGCYFLQTRGIDTSAWAQDTSFGGVAFDPIWRGAIRAASIYVPVTLMWLICFFASVYPAVLMVRLKPVDAIASHG